VGTLLDRRTLTLVGGFVLAVAATLAVFLTDNRQYLRIAVVAVAWAFVLATFAAGRRTADRATAAAREAQLRHAYELELEREVAARREYELDLEHDLRREAEDAMRHELDSLRSEIASLGRLRDEVAGVSELRQDLAGLAAMRDDVARLAALREDLSALSSLRHDLGQLADLRSDLGRLRAELAEQLSSEMLVERIVMRTQGARLEPPGRPLDVPVRWSEDTPPRELTGGWPAIRLDDPRETPQVEPVRADRPAPERPVAPPPSWSGVPVTSAFPAPSAAPSPASGPWTSAFDEPMPPPPDGPPSRSRTDDAADRYAAAPPVAPIPAEPHETPLEWLTARSLLDPDGPRPVTPPPVPPASPPQPPVTEARPTAFRPSPHPRPTPPPPSARRQPDLSPLRRRSDDLEPATAERPLATGGSPSAAATGHPPARDGGSAASGGDGNDGRLAEILAENGVSPAAGGRRRRRYREDDEPDDVLARVLGLG
jgi:hypothetical protein